MSSSLTSLPQRLDIEHTDGKAYFSQQPHSAWKQVGRSLQGLVMKQKSPEP